MKIHPLAELFPPISGDELRRLADDIAANGLQEPIWTLDGQILDGRNRWNACRLARVECRTVEYVGDNPLGFVISMNLHRRQLTRSQLAIVGVEVEAERAKEAKLRKADRCRASILTRSRDAIGRLRTHADQVPPFLGEPGCATPFVEVEGSRGISGNLISEATATTSSATSTSRRSESARQAARELGVSHGYISKAKRIVRESPQLAPLVKSGQLSLHQAALLARASENGRETMPPVVTPPHEQEEAEAKSKSIAPAPSGTPRTVLAERELSRFRRCFSGVFSRYLRHAQGELSPLAKCLSEMLMEVENASLMMDTNPVNRNAAVAAATDRKHVAR